MGSRTWHRDRHFLDRYRELEPGSDRTADRTFALAERLKLVDDVPGDTGKVVACSTRRPPGSSVPQPLGPVRVRFVSRVRRAVDEFISGRPESVVHLPTGRGVIINGR